MDNCNKISEKWLPTVFQVIDFYIFFQRFHEPRSLNGNEVLEVSSMSDMARFDTILTNILVPRVVGTESHKKVREVSSQVYSFKSYSYRINQET